MANINAVVYGASGLTGTYLIGLLDNNKAFSSVTAASRNKPLQLPPACNWIPFSVNDIVIPKNTQIVFCALGTTIKKAGSKQNFENIDSLVITKLASEALNAGVKTFVLISSVAADDKSANFYLSVKGKTEEFLKSLNFESLYIIRPSLLIGNRNEKRRAEKVAGYFLNPLSFLFIGKLAKYKPIKAIDLAKAMINISTSNAKEMIFEGNNLHKYYK